MGNRSLSVNGVAGLPLKTAKEQRGVSRKKVLSEDEQAKVFDVAPVPEYVPTDREARGLQTFKDRREQRPAFPSLKIDISPASGVASVAPDHKDHIAATSMQIAALGLSDVREFNALLKNVINCTQSSDKANEGQANEMLALVVGIGPTNSVEAMLAVQMAAVHGAAMTAATRLHVSKTVEQTAANMKAFNNLTRTFAVQAETLKKLRGSGEQRVVVEHKHYHLASGAIAPGSQAVLGDVRGGADKVEGSIP